METWLAEALPAEATNQILIGPIFGLEVVEDARMRVSRECDVQKYMENHIMEFVTSVTDPSSARTRGKMILFSAINFPDEKTGETH